MPSPQYTRFVFTINNPTDVDRLHVANLGDGPLVRYLVVGREIGQSGTPHLQGFVIFVTKTTFARVKDHLPRAHIQHAVATSAQASAYCKKDGDFDEYGALPVGNTKNSVLEDLYAWGHQFITDNGRAPSPREIATAHPTAFVRYPRVCELLQHWAPVPELRSGEPRPWQLELEQQLNADADDRTVNFFIDEQGGKGKSWFQGWYLSKYPDKTQILSIGKRDDIAHTIDQTKSVFLFNVPRGAIDMLQYTILEQLKDRIVFSPKYNSTMKMFMTKVHVVVFVNEQPDFTKMSEDRYVIHDLND